MGRIIKVKWVSPPRGWCKLNSDGMRTSDGQSGCVGVIRGDEGEWIRGFTCKLEDCNAFNAEIEGITIGLQICWELGLKKIVAESDASVVVEAINNMVYNSGCNWGLEKICELLKRDWQIEVQHTYREGNRASNKMAKLRMKQAQGMTVWNTPPSEVCEIR